MRSNSLCSDSSKQSHFHLQLPHASATLNFTSRTPLSTPAFWHVKPLTSSSPAKPPTTAPFSTLWGVSLLQPDGQMTATVLCRSANQRRFIGCAFVLLRVGACERLLEKQHGRSTTAFEYSFKNMPLTSNAIICLWKARRFKTQHAILLLHHTPHFAFNVPIIRPSKPCRHGLHIQLDIFPPTTCIIRLFDSSNTPKNKYRKLIRPLNTLLSAISCRPLAISSHHSPR